MAHFERALLITLSTTQVAGLGRVGTLRECSEDDTYLSEMTLLQQRVKLNRTAHMHEHIGDTDAGRSHALQFVHIPKNAGTSIESAGLQNGFFWGRYMDYPSQKHSCNFHHMPPKYLKNPSPYIGAELFAVIRHPYDRALSEYTYQVNGGNLLKWKDAGLPRFVAQNVSHVNDWPICSVEGLNGWTQRALRGLMDESIFLYDCHYIPQSEYIWGRGGRWIKDLLRFEELPGAFNTLMESRGNPTRLTAERNNTNSFACPKISRNDFSNETRAMLDVVYRQDFDLLGFERT